MPPSSSPLHQIVETNDVDQAREAFARTYTKASIEPCAYMPFFFTSTLAAVGAVHATTDEWSSGVYLTTSAHDERYILGFSTEGFAVGTHAGEEFVMVPGRRGVMFSPLRASTLRHEGKMCASNLTMDQGALEAHWTNLTGQTLRGVIQFTPELDLTRSAGAAVYNVAQVFRREVQRESPSRLVLSNMRDALFTVLLTAVPHSASGHLEAPPPRVAPGCVRRAEEFIVAHAADPITLDDVVAAAGVPARSLHAAFQSCRGTTPMAFLRDRRFELARKRLLAATPRSTVGGVVRDLGLGHLGRFSTAYKQRFGESPSETIARTMEREGWRNQPR